MKKFYLIGGLFLFLLIVIISNFLVIDHFNSVKQFIKNYEFDITALISYLFLFLLLLGTSYCFTRIFTIKNKSQSEPIDLDKNLEYLKRDLTAATQTHRYYGIFLSIFLILIFVFLTYEINYNFIESQSIRIEALIRLNYEYAYLLPLYYLTRAMIFGTFFSGASFFIYKLAKNSLDQSVRYKKRLDSMIFLNFILNSEKFTNDKIKFEKIDDLVKFFEIWTKSIDSAFTDVTKLKEENEVKSDKTNIYFKSNSEKQG